MPQIHGPITDRLPTGTPDEDGWAYHRDEEATNAVAADGYRLGSRWRRKRPPFLFELLNITFPSMALMVVLLITQAASLGYLR